VHGFFHALGHGRFGRRVDTNNPCPVMLATGTGSFSMAADRIN
jgi:hypothetical protein